MNVKPGDLAIVIDADEPSDALGRICEVLHAGEYVDYIGLGVQPCWRVRFPHPVVSAYGHMVIETFAPDCILRPVSGLTDPIEEDRHEPIPVPV